MTTNDTTAVKPDAPLADYAISEPTVKRAQWENLQVAACPGANHCNVCNYSHPIAEKADHTHTVTLEHGMPVECTCKAFEYNEGLCKHCLAVAADADAIDTAIPEQAADTDTTEATAVTDGGQDTTFDPDAETVTDAWNGAFIHTSWGYDQTNVEFAQITEVSDTGKTVLACRVTAEQVGHGRTTEELQPTPEQFGDEFRLHVRNTRGNPAFRGSYPYINGDMDEGTRLDTFLPVGNPAENTIRQTAPNHGH